MVGLPDFPSGAMEHWFDDIFLFGLAGTIRY